MGERDDGGSAFPVADMQSAQPWTTDESKAMARGMSLRDYFAAHAPTEVPEWFEHAKPFVVPSTIGIDEALALDPNWPDVPATEQAAIKDWARDPCYDMDDPMSQQIGEAALKRCGERGHERERATTANRAARWFAWRWHYADTMLKTRQT